VALTEHEGEQVEQRGVGVPEGDRGPAQLEAGPLERALDAAQPQRGLNGLDGARAPRACRRLR
jgi:hypothetical protein